MKDNTKEIFHLLNLADENFAKLESFSKQLKIVRFVEFIFLVGISCLVVFSIVGEWKLLMNSSLLFSVFLPCLFVVFLLFYLIETSYAKRIEEKKKHYEKKVYDVVEYVREISVIMLKDATTSDQLEYKNRIRKFGIGPSEQVASVEYYFPINVFVEVFGVKA